MITFLSRLLLIRNTQNCITTHNPCPTKRWTVKTFCVRSIIPALEKENFERKKHLISQLKKQTDRTFRRNVLNALRPGLWRLQHIILSLLYSRVTQSLMSVEILFHRSVITKCVVTSLQSEVCSLQSAVCSLQMSDTGHQAGDVCCLRCQLAFQSLQAQEESARLDEKVSILK